MIPQVRVNFLLTNMLRTVEYLPFQIYSPTVRLGVCSQIPRGMKNILATTWSNPSDTKAKIGNHMPIIFEWKSFACIAR